MSFDAQMVLREAEAPVARPILLLISFSELLPHDKTPPKYVNCSTWPSFVPSMLIWIAGGSREQHWTSVLDVLIFNPNRNYAFSNEALCNDALGNDEICYDTFYK